MVKEEEKKKKKKKKRKKREGRHFVAVSIDSVTSCMYIHPWGLSRHWSRNKSGITIPAGAIPGGQINEHARISKTRREPPFVT
jgi:hypothetical protein